jgi:hypothetical protein
VVCLGNLPPKAGTDVASQPVLFQREDDWVENHVSPSSSF